MYGSSRVDHRGKLLAILAAGGNPAGSASSTWNEFVSRCG
jgi:hypothetical protein